MKTASDGAGPEVVDAARTSGSAVANAVPAILETLSGHAIIATDLTGLILVWGDGARRFYGYDPDEVVGRVGVSALHAPGDIDAGPGGRMLEDALRRGRYEGTHTCRRKTGELLVARLAAMPYHDGRGAPVGFLIMLADVSDDRPLTGNARGLIESSPDLFVTVSPDGRITDVNLATVAAVGLARDLLIGTAFSGYVTDPGGADQCRRQVLAEGRVADCALSIRHLSGRLTETLCRASPYCERDGRILGILVVARDVTALRQADAAIEDQHARDRERLAELERFQRLTLDRELKMIELKKEIEGLKRERLP